MTENRQGQKQHRYTDRDRNKTGIQTRTGARQVYRQGQEQDRYTERERTMTENRQGKEQERYTDRDRKKTVY